MRVPLSWLREYVDAPADPAVLEPALVRMGLEVESIVDLAATVDGPLVVGRVSTVDQLPGVKKSIRYCLVDVGEREPRGIVCGATNFVAGDLVVVALPGAVLPGGFAIAARKTYGKVSDGMICSARELHLGEDHSGIVVLPSTVDATPGDDARGALGLDDLVIELSITADRGYCLSVRGIARELSHALGRPYRDPAAIEAPGATDEPPYPVRVEDPIGCDRFAARLVTGVDPDAVSPQWMRSRLVHAGVRSISLAVDITNYLMIELGQPMHAFDRDRITGELVVRRARPGERLVTLDGVDRALDEEDMVICDGGVPISLAAVMGGASSEVADTTSNVLFEAAHWDPVMVARTARRHRLFSEAAKRWERGVDPTLPLAALERAVGLLVEYGGGTADPRVGDLDAVRPRAAIALPASEPSRIAGVSYSDSQVRDSLVAVGCAVTGTDPLTVTPPPWRPDLTDPADLVEEVVRLQGYDEVPTILPLAPPGRGRTPRQRRHRSVGRALAEAGYVEVLSYPFVASGVLDALGLPADDPRRSTLRLANPLSEEEPELRTTLLGPLLGTLRRNLGRGLRDVGLYEVGPVFLPRSADGEPPVLGVADRPSDVDLELADEFVPDQPWHVGVVLSGDAEPAGWWGAGRPAGWADAIEAARIALAAAGVPDASVEVRRGNRAPWHPGRCAEILVDGQPIGYAGELHPAVCTAMELSRRTCAAELDLDAVPYAAPVPAPPISGYPPALIDVALVVPAGTPATDVERALADGAGALLESVRLFDVYASDQLGAGRKSLAYKLTFRAPDRTLTAQEAVAARDAAVAEAADRVGATLRGA